MNHADKPPHWWERDLVPGVLLFAAASISFVLQNSPLQPGVEALLHAPLGMKLGPLDLHSTVGHFISDGLMALFFFYVGLELKREAMEGSFQNPREAALPLAGALGGMLVPALIYLAIAAPAHVEYASGWAIPAATDIAFALGVLALLGKRAPRPLRLFLLALAIADDLGAILVIALFYSQGVTPWALGGAVLTFLTMLLLNFLGLKRLAAYWLLALVLWGFVAASGVHATIAGVLAALTIPMRASDGRSPLNAAEHELKPWVLLGVMPLFALANAGAPLGGAGLGALAHPVAIAVALGLCIGKPVGIVSAVVIGARLMRRDLPMPRIQLIGAGMIAGVGFTMSLFIGALAFGEGDAVAPMRLGVLMGSIVSAVAGVWLLWRSAPRETTTS